MYNPTVQSGTVVNGAIVPDSESFVNPFQELRKQSG